MDTPNKKILATLFFSVFATVTGVGIVVPLLPIYVHDLGAGGIYIGLIFWKKSIIFAWNNKFLKQLMLGGQEFDNQYSCITFKKNIKIEP